MNDDLQQIREATFNRIVFALVLVSLIGGLIILGRGEFSWPWFLRAAALLIVTSIAFILQRNGQFAVAAYVIVLELVGVVTGLFLQPGPVSQVTPYLFLPIIVIAGLILSPLAALMTALLSIVMAAAALAFTGQLRPDNLSHLWPPFGLAILTAALAAEGSRYVSRLSSHLNKNQKLLQERSLTMLEALEKAEKLQRKVAKLEQELLHAQTEAGQSHRLASERDNQLFNLIKGIVRELATSKEELQELIDKAEANSRPGEPDSSFEEIRQKIDRLDKLGAHLAEMAELDSQNVSLHYQPVAVGELISEAVNTARSWVGDKKDVKVRYRLAEDLPRIQVDPARIRQALLHLLSNAVKYTDQGIIEVQAELTDEAELIIFVSDTGIGMYREEIDLIFQKFEHGRGTLAQQRHGAGLGLAISKRLIELHGGQMWASSVLGVGSTFYLTLPLEPIASQVPAPVTADLAPESTIVSLGRFPDLEAAAPAAGEQEATLISSKLDTKVFPTLAATEASSAAGPPAQPEQTQLNSKAASKLNFGPPVARFGPTYISRFGLILLALLLIIAGVVAALAIFNKPGAPKEVIRAELSPPSNAIVEKAATSTLPEATSSLLATATPQATATLPPVTTPAAPAQPSATLPSLPTKSLITLPTRLPATVTASPTATPPNTSTPQPSPGPPQAGLPASETTPNPVVPAAVIQSTPRPSPQLSFMINQGPNQILGLYSLAGQTTTEIPITANALSQDGFSWSPDGHLLFTASTGGYRQIYVIQAGSSQPAQLTHSAADNLQPAWSPDGRKIAFSSGRTGNFDIYVMDADGSNLQQLTSSRGYDEWPFWSPNGQKLAFVSDRDGNVEIYTMNVDGSDQQRLTHHPADDWPAAWAPAGDQLVFSSNRDSNWNLFLIEADGSNLRRLTNDPANERAPIWSPDGQTIAFTYDGGDNIDIYTLPVPSGDFVDIPRHDWIQITNTPFNEQAPAWLP